jgi:anion-transporting  ArsA/GET3 family ATPase
MALPRLIFVTGKGGTGKSTAAAALALEIARHKAVIVGDLDQRNGAARILKSPSATAGRKNLDMVRLSPRHELELFVERIVPIKAVSRRMLSSRTFALVSAALPGLEAFLMLDRLRIMAGEAALHDRYVVIDAPATGTALELLLVARATAALAPRGTLNRLAHEIEGFIRDPNRFGVVIMLNPEHLAVREALDAHAKLVELQIFVMGVILNCVAPPLFSRSEVDSVASTAGIHGSLALRRFESGRAVDRTREQLGAVDVPVVELSMMFKRSISGSDLSQIGKTLAHGLENREG